MSEASKAFVAGATGYVGQAVVRALRDRGVETVAHVRPDSKHLERWRGEWGALGVTVDTTQWEPAAMAARLAALSPDFVFALLGTTRRRARAEGIEGDLYDRIDYGLTALLHDAASEAPPGPRFIYLSSVGTGPRSSSAYLRARWRAEEKIRAGALPHVIARPSFITGADREEPRPGERAAAAATDAALAVAGLFGARRLRDRYRSTDAATLAAALVRLALEPDGDAVLAEGDALRG
jgi:uncharacterized protein YbjT (DUF2867 family)